MEGDETGGLLGDYGSITSFKNKSDESLNWDGTERDRLRRHWVGE